MRQGHFAMHYWPRLAFDAITFSADSLFTGAQARCQPRYFPIRLYSIAYIINTRLRQLHGYISTRLYDILLLTMTAGHFLTI